MAMEFAPPKCQSGPTHRASKTALLKKYSIMGYIGISLSDLWGEFQAE